MRQTRLSPITTAAAIALALAACSNSGPDKPPAEPSEGPAPTAAAAPTPAPAPAPEAPVVARFDDHTITADEAAAIVKTRKDAPTPDVVRAAVEEMVDVALVAAEARAAGFDKSAAAEHAAERALAARYLDDKLRREAAATVTDADIASYWTDRRRAAKLLVATRAKASELQSTMLKAIAEQPDKAADIFADFRRKFGLAAEAKADVGERVPFDLEGLGPLGQPVAHERVAMGAFALREVGAVSPPIPLQDDRWALVQVRGIHAGVPAADLSAAQKEQARAALVGMRIQEHRARLLARLRADHQVRLEDARITALSQRLLGSGGRVIRRHKAIGKVVPLDRLQLHEDRLPKRPMKKTLIKKDGAKPRLDAVVPPSQLDKAARELELES